MRVDKRLFLVISVSVLLQACSHLGVKTPSTNSAEANATPSDKTEVAAADSNTNPDIDRLITENNAVMAENEDQREVVPLKVPAEINQRVEYWINYFTVDQKERTQRFLERGLPLQAHIEKILRDNDMPPELFYLAMIESGFVTSAKSRAKAVGVWQFMKSTGKNYGLAVNGLQDERRNWIKSTEAAASYLKDLNNVFGSWYLALASYNAGEHRIVRSIMEGKTRDFWALAEAGFLPEETLNYVPKFLAAMIVGKNLKKYGFEVTPEETWGDYETVSVPAGVSLQNIAKTTGASLPELERWNRDLIKGITPVTRSGMVDIYAPKGFGKLIADNFDALKKLRPIASAVQLARRSEPGENLAYYVVRSGDTLASISHNLGTSRRTLMKMNGLHRSRIHVGQRLKYKAGSERSIASVRTKGGKSGHRHHRVKKGENLASIAKHYGTSVDDLVRLNSLKSPGVTTGQRLVVK